MLKDEVSKKEDAPGSASFSMSPESSERESGVPDEAAARRELDDALFAAREAGGGFRCGFSPGSSAGSMR